MVLDSGNQATLFTVIQQFAKHRAKHQERMEDQYHLAHHPSHRSRRTPRHLSIGLGQRLGSITFQSSFKYQRWYLGVHLTYMDMDIA